MVSIGISLPNFRVGYQVTYDLIQKAAVAAEHNGFDSVWVADHLVPHRGPETPVFECWTTLSALARDTTKIRLGTYVTSNTFRYPSLLAKMASVVDVISGGRVELGLGSGYNETEHQRYGIPLFTYGRRMRQFREGVHIIRAMFTEEAPTFKGEFYEIQEAINYPKPVQNPHPPIWIGGQGLKLLKIAAEFADWWQHPRSHAISDEGFQQKSAQLDEFCVELGRKPEQIKRSLGLTFFIEKDEDRLKERRKALGNLPPDQGGTPDRWIERFRGYKDSEVSQFILSIPDPFAMFKDMELLADLVLPNI
jgi:F420-dependent oxidoreductase-like protein